MNVFGRVGMESLFLDVPFVCKSWYRATLNPSCWQYLIFPDLTAIDLHNGIDDDYWFVAKERLFLSGYLHICASGDVLKYAAAKCPALKELVLPSRSVEYKSSLIQELIGKWTNLEYLELATSYNLENFLGQISIHCKNLRRLSVANNADIDKDKAMAIVSLLPKLKQLILKWANIDRGALVTLLQGCNELVHLDVSHCKGFDEGDEEIAKLASHVANFRSRGSIR